MGIAFADRDEDAILPVGRGRDRLRTGLGREDQLGDDLAVGGIDAADAPGCRVRCEQETTRRSERQVDGSAKSRQPGSRLAAASCRTEHEDDDAGDGLLEERIGSHGAP